MAINKWHAGKDKIGPSGKVLTRNPSTNPVDINKEAKKGSNIKRNKIGQVINR